MDDPLKELFAIEEQKLVRAAEAVHIVYIRSKWAAHEIISYSNTQDPEDLMSAERLLVNIQDEVKHALSAIQKEIERQDSMISREKAALSYEG